MRVKTWAVLWALAVGGLHEAAAAPFGTMFTYQGRLTDSNGPAAGPHDFEFWLWSRDTGGTNFGIIAAAALPVSNGLFTVDLDYGSNVFDFASTLWLEIHVQQAGNTNPLQILAPRIALRPAPFAVLAGDVPDGSIGTAKLKDGAVSSGKLGLGAVTADRLAAGAVTAPAIASGAINGLHITNGAIGSLQLASNCISSSKIVDGSILGADLAAGVVGEPQLAKPYRSGEITFSLDTWTFVPLVVTQSLNPVFTAKPVVTAQVEQQADDPVDRAFGVRLLDRAASGFVARVSTAMQREPVADDVYALVPPALVLAGTGTAAYPAFVAPRIGVSRYLFFERADSDGRNWRGTAITTNGQEGQAWGTVGGYPAACFERATDHRLVFMRAANVQGSIWNSETVVDGVGTNAWPAYPCMAGGRPAIAYAALVAGNPQLRFARAADPNGDAWGSVSLIAPALTGFVVAVASVAGNPVVVVAGSPAGLHYVRAADPDGTTWSAPVTLFTNMVGNAACALVGGRPAVTYGGHGYTNIFYLRALDAVGAAWPAPRGAAFWSGGLSDAPHDLVEANGRPVLVFRRESKILSREGADLDGLSWGAEVELSGDSQTAPDLTRVLPFRGGLAVVRVSVFAEDEFYWSGGPPPARLSWTAVLP